MNLAQLDAGQRGVAVAGEAREITRLAQRRQGDIQVPARGALHELALGDRTGFLPRAACLVDFHRADDAGQVSAIHVHVKAEPAVIRRSVQRRLTRARAAGDGELDVIEPQVGTGDAAGDRRRIEREIVEGQPALRPAGETEVRGRPGPPALDRARCLHAGR